MVDRLKIHRVLGILFLLVATFVPAQGNDSTGYTYDLSSRLITALYGSTVCAVYGYDASGNRISQTTLSGGSGLTPSWGTGIWGCFQWSP